MNNEAGKKIEYTSISHSDATGLALLDAQCFSVPWSEKAFFDEAQNEMANYVIAKADGEIAGYIGYWRVVDEGQITNIAVGEKFRRQGIAKKMLSLAIERAKEQGLFCLTLEVRESNLAAMSLYSSFGFYEVGKRKNYYHKPSEAAVLMQLDL